MNNQDWKYIGKRITLLMPMAILIGFAIIKASKLGIDIGEEGFKSFFGNYIGPALAFLFEDLIWGSIKGLVVFIFDWYIYDVIPAAIATGGAGAILVAMSPLVFFAVLFIIVRRFIWFRFWYGKSWASYKDNYLVVEDGPAMVARFQRKGYIPHAGPSFGGDGKPHKQVMVRKGTFS